MKIAFFGGVGVGKSTLAHSFASFCQKRGRSSCVANFDAGCRHILYKPAFDLRTYYSLRKVLMQGDGLRSEQALAEIYRRACSDAVFNSDFRKACVQKEVVLLDFAGSLDYFLLGGGGRVLSHFCDKAVFVTDYHSLISDQQGLLVSSLNLLLKNALAMPCVAFVNKCEVLEKKRRRLLQKSLVAEEITPSLQSQGSFIGGVVKGSALEGMGLRELFTALEL